MEPANVSAAPIVAKPEVKKGAKKEEAPQEDKLTISNAVYGEVVTRFPPEASGFIHIGHAKAAFVNRMLADKYGGKMLFRFDDTNPDKEKHEFEKIIIEDLATLGVTWDVGPTYSSDYMDMYTEKANELLAKGLAYCDITDREEMQKARYDGYATPCREGNSQEENMRLWAEMQKGSEEGATACLRAKVSVTDPNKAMRDPVIFRVNMNPHARQGRKYNAYPTYDFCCPLIDSVEGVTHALRTNEYHDRNAQYDWMLDSLGMRKPHIEDFSRLNMEYALMSKRKLTALVDKGVVTGWDDPRFPTVRALVRRGLKISALKEFVKVQGMSKAVNFMEWSKLWNFNVQILDPSVPRYTVVSAELGVKCHITNNTEADKVELTRPRHKKNEALGEKPFFKTTNVMLDAEDVKLVKEGDEVTLMDWGNAFIRNIKMDEAGNPCAAELELNPTGDVRKTKYKLTWVPDCTEATIPIICNEYDHLLTKKKPEGDESIDSILAPVTQFTQKCTGEVAMAELKHGEYLQLERRGYYIVDAVEPVLTLIAIPDGREKVNHLCAKYQYLKTLPPGPDAGKGGKKGGGADGLTLEEKRAIKAAKKAAGAAGPKKDKAKKAAKEAEATKGAEEKAPEAEKPAQ